MAIIKSFTDLEQSRKLAEILPLESADMFHFIHEVDTVGFGYKKDAAEFYSKTEFEYVPCWSLAALLGVLPEGIIENYYAPNLQKENGKYSIAYGDDELLCIANNLVDACVAMIEKLHELKIVSA